MSNRPTVTVTFPDRFGGSHVRSDDLVWSVGWVDAGTYELVPVGETADHRNCHLPDYADEMLADLRERIDGLRKDISGPPFWGNMELYLSGSGWNDALDAVLVILEADDEQ